MVLIWSAVHYRMLSVVYTVLYTDARSNTISRISPLHSCISLQLPYWNKLIIEKVQFVPQHPPSSCLSLLPLLCSLRLSVLDHQPSWDLVPAPGCRCLIPVGWIWIFIPRSLSFFLSLSPSLVSCPISLCVCSSPDVWNGTASCVSVQSVLFGVFTIEFIRPKSCLLASPEWWHPPWSYLLCLHKWSNCPL